jgi:hypothetical protein
MSKKVVKILLCLLCISSAYAGDSKGKVAHLMVHRGDVVMFSAGQHSNKPSCSKVGEHWALSLKTEDGKSMYALLLSAAAQGNVVGVLGDNTCNAWGDREQPLHMWVDYDH